jgi:transcriptional regulator with XRE-family HTH domain
LAGVLRQLRESAVLTGEEAAAQLGWSASKISRIETGQNAVETDDLLRMLDAYQVVGLQRDGLIEFARSVDEYKRGWWDAFAGTLGSGYSSMIALEAGARSERQYVPTLVPGLLQTEAYAAEIVRSSLLDVADEEIRQRVLVRTKRQRELKRSEPLNLFVVVDEAVLRRHVGGPGIMKEQLSYLVEMARLSNITLQVLPFANGPHPAGTGGFTILRFPGIIATEIVYLENMTSELFIQDAGEVARYGRAFDRLCEIALDPEGSITLITQISSQIN